MEITMDIMLKELKKKLEEKKKPLIAIDGLGGSGKSQLSKQIKRLNPEIEIIKIDDFYLPENLRKNLNINNISNGENFDINRLIKQVIRPYLNNDPIIYQKYDWEKNELGNSIEVSNDKLLLIEGVYSLSKNLNSYFDIKLWVECKRDIRLHRGLVRDGEKSYDIWVNEWMVLETKYVNNQFPQFNAQYIIFTDAPNVEYKILKH